MVIVQLTGGLGNQMFQYAFGRYIAEKNQTVLKLDTHILLDRSPGKSKLFVFRNFDLDIFNITAQTASLDEISRFITPLYSNKYYYLFRRILKKPYNRIIEPHFHFAEEMLGLTLTDCYLIGGWQSENYFKSIENIIRKEFSFNFKLDSRDLELLDKIQNSNSVCVHIRRGDYVNHPVHGVTGLDYYEKAINYLTSKISNIKLYIFSDDIEWCKQNFSINNIKSFFVDHSCTNGAFKYDLKLMTACKYYIIPNSTFGWWAAWLNPNKEKIVIAPEKWFNDSKYDTQNLIPDDWIKI